MAAKSFRLDWYPERTNRASFEEGIIIILGKARRALGWSPAGLRENGLDIGQAEAGAAWRRGACAA